MDPIKVWEELDGIPKYQVSKFHVIAAVNPAKITRDPVVSLAVTFNENGSTISLAIAFATPTNEIAPRKFITAASITATRGGNARVETDVAMEFAVSWKPLIKSKTSANITTSIVMINIKSI